MKKVHSCILPRKWVCATDLNKASFAIIMRCVVESKFISVVHDQDIQAHRDFLVVHYGIRSWTSTLTPLMEVVFAVTILEDFLSTQKTNGDTNSHRSCTNMYRIMGQYILTSKGLFI